jgi:alpha-galactosidase
VPSRREFLERAGLAVTGLSLTGLDGRALSSRGPAHAAQSASSRSYLDLHRQPDSVVAQLAPSIEKPLRLLANGRWEDQDVALTISPSRDAIRVELEAPRSAVRRLRLRWRGGLDDVRLLLGDAWERGYGDLEWRGFVPDRVMPWYFLTSDGRLTHAYGVRTGANAFCYWLADSQGITLWADVRSGGTGVELHDRRLALCEIVTREGTTGETAFAALRTFTRRLCREPRLPNAPVYGSNDWYWAYGQNSAETVLVDAQHIVDLSPDGANRPFVVIDDGWQPERGRDKTGVGVWNRGNEKFPDMPGLAAEIRKRGARPGIWIRPLLAATDTSAAQRLGRDRAILDPTVPEVRQKIADDITRLRGWGFDLIKHDYSTFDIFGRWGSTMNDTLTRDGWTFAAGPTRTTAEVIADLYQTIRNAAGPAFVIGCNTVSHLSAGIFEICRVGDDTSGREWNRTRKMGVNTLAFRGAQHGAFYVADPDCVGVTNAIPWAQNRQWLDLLARSGTMLFVSLSPDALTDDRRRDLRAALALAAQPQPLGEPVDWQQSSWPRRWNLMGQTVTYDWVGENE